MTAGAAALDTTFLVTRRSSIGRIRRMVTGDPLALLGVALISLFVFLAVFGPYIAPSPGSGAGVIDVANAYKMPSAAHLFGTDELGRDVLTRVILGARPALVISLFVVFLAVLIGVPLGAIAGYRRGRVDAVIMRIADMFLAFPPLLLAMAIVAALGASLEHAALALAVSWWPWYTRIARGTAVSIRELPFVDAARTMGLSDRSIIARHVVPNSLTPIVVQAMLDMGTVILAAGGLAFLGLGAKPPFPDWGLMVASGRGDILSAWWVSALPGVAIFLATLGFTLMGDFLVRALDPRQN